MFEQYNGIPLGGWSGGGQMPGFQQKLAEIDSFYKAITAAGGSDVAALTGGAALRRESIETAVRQITQRPEHFVIYNKIAKTPARSLLHEFTQQRDVGGIPGSGAVGELGPIALTTGDYKRQTVKLKLIKDRRIVTLEGEIQAENGLGSAIAKETNAGALKLGTDIEYLTVYGNEACNPYEYDGLIALLEAVGGDHVLDMRAQPLSADAREIADSCRLIWDQGNWGRATDVFHSGRVQTDFDQKLAAGARIQLTAANQEVRQNTPVIGINTRFGQPNTNPSTFIQESGPPYIVRGGNFAMQLSASGTSVVSSVAGVGSANAASRWLASQAGLFYYGVQAIGPNGDSALVVSAQVAVAAGDRVAVTITPPGGNNAIAYRIFRGRKNGTNAPSDMREMARVPANGDTPVVYNDDNQNIPGTSVAIVCTLQDDAMELKRFLPMQRFPLAAVDNTIYTWAQIVDVALMLGKERQHRLIKNILPSGVDWQPF